MYIFSLSSPVTYRVAKDGEFAATPVHLGRIMADVHDVLCVEFCTNG